MWNNVSGAGLITHIAKEGKGRGIIISANIRNKQTVSPLI